jgi:hypothetical protein
VQIAVGPTSTSWTHRRSRTTIGPRRRLTLGTENDAPIEIHYEDHGRDQPVVLIYGYPVNGNSSGRQERDWSPAEEVNATLFGFLVDTTAALESNA